jgi:hypothetical protein
VESGLSSWHAGNARNEFGFARNADEFSFACHANEFSLANEALDGVAIAQDFVFS